MSSLGLIIRSSIPALTSVLVGSVLILLNLWVYGTEEDKYWVLQTLGGGHLNTSLGEPQLNTAFLYVCSFLTVMAIFLGLLHLRALLKLFCKYFLESKDPDMEDSANFICTFLAGFHIIALGSLICTCQVNIYVMLMLFYLYIFTLKAQVYFKSKQLNCVTSSMS